MLELLGVVQALLHHELILAPLQLLLAHDLLHLPLLVFQVKVVRHAI